MVPAKVGPGRTFVPCSLVCPRPGATSGRPRIRWTPWWDTCCSTWTHSSGWTSSSHRPVRGRRLGRGRRRLGSPLLSTSGAPPRTRRRRGRLIEVRPKSSRARRRVSPLPSPRMQPALSPRMQPTAQPLTRTCSLAAAQRPVCSSRSRRRRRSCSVKRVKPNQLTFTTRNRRERDQGREGESGVATLVIQLKEKEKERDCASVRATPQNALREPGAVPLGF